MQHGGAVNALEPEDGSSSDVSFTIQSSQRSVDLWGSGDQLSSFACDSSDECSTSDRRSLEGYGLVESRFRQLATAQLLRSTFHDNGGGPSADDHARLSRVLSTERTRNQVTRLQLMESIAQQALRLRVLEEQERRMSQLVDSLEATHHLPGGLAAHMDLVLQIVYDMNEARLEGGSSVQSIAASVTQQVADIGMHAAWGGGCDSRSFRKMLHALETGGNFAVSSSMEGCRFNLPLHQIGQLGIDTYMQLHNSYLQAMGRQASQPHAACQLIRDLANELVLLRLAFGILNWTTFLSFRTANASNLPLGIMQAATEKAQVLPQQAGDLHRLYARHRAEMMAVDREDQQVRAQLQGALIELSAAGTSSMSSAPYQHLLELVERMKGHSHKRTLLQMDFNIRACFEVLQPRQLALLFAECAPYHLRIDLLVDNNFIPMQHSSCATNVD